MRTTSFVTHFLPAASRRLFGAWNLLTRPVYWWYERQLTRAVRSSGRVPNHLGLILDGNRRYARRLGLRITQGHDLGAHKARQVLEWCLELGIRHVTLWVFSTDNRNRDPAEVGHLLRLFAREAAALGRDQRLHENRVRVTVIGEITDFPPDVQQPLRQLEAVTREYDGLRLNIAVGYGGREEIVAAVRKLLRERAAQGQTLAEAGENLSAEDIGRHLYTYDIPDPDFIIRTSGEIRLSGFLLWQSVYSEFYFCDALWPEFRKVDFLRALRSFQARERRYGR